MSEQTNQVTGEGLLAQVNASRKKKKIESLKGKISKMLDDREAAEKVLADIDATILDELQDAGLSADDIAAVLS
jgi:hypothetical protein